MNLSQLQYVKKVFETGSFSRAAQLCFVTQPSLSNAIAQLEKELGGRLFFRTTHSVKPTPFGEKLLPLVESVLDAQGELLKTARKLVEPERKSIRIGFCPSVNVHLLTSRLKPFKKSNPEVEIILRECLTSDLKQHLETFEIDFACAPESFEMSGAGRTFFYDEELYCLPKGSKSFFNDAEKSIRLEEIAGETIVFTGEGCGLAAALRNLFYSRDFIFNEYAGRALSYQVLEDWAALGIGAAILPKSKISQKNENARPLLLSDGKPAGITFQTIWNENAPQSRIYKLLIRYFKKNASKYAKEVLPSKPF